METREPPYFPISGPWIFSFFLFFNFFLFCKTPKAGFVVWLNILKKKLPPHTHTHTRTLLALFFVLFLPWSLHLSKFQPATNTTAIIYRINYCKPGGCYDNASRYGWWMLRDSLHGSGFPALIRSHWGDITNLLLAATLKYLSSCK